MLKLRISFSSIYSVQRCIINKYTKNDLKNASINILTMSLYILPYPTVFRIIFSLHIKCIDSWVCLQNFAMNGNGKNPKREKWLIQNLQLKNRACSKEKRSWIQNIQDSSFDSKKNNIAQQNSLQWTFWFRKEMKKKTKNVLIES